MAAALLGAALIWNASRQLDLDLRLAWSPSSCLLGLLAAVPPLLMIPLLESPLGERIPGLRGLRRSTTSVLAPLLGNLRRRDMVALSLLAGLSEEVFFRGVMQPEIGLLPTSVAFGLLHAVNGPYVIWATLVGSYFGWLLHIHPNLWMPIVAHTMVDLVGLWYLRFVVVPRTVKLLETGGSDDDLGEWCDEDLVR